MASDGHPAYVRLLPSGELHRRASMAVRALESCLVCPNGCAVDRLRDQTGLCQIGRLARVASCGPHFGEEDCLRGRCGSGTIFFSGCNLRCVFCQNWEISHLNEGRKMGPAELAAAMLELQEMGCHNINWVTPDHVVPQALEALVIAAEQGLRLPIVFNSSAYVSVETLRWLDGVVDIYMPDFKFWDPEIAARLTQGQDYPAVARRAIAEMHRQVGDLQLDDVGVARKGLLVRHLVMPESIAGTREIARWLAREMSPNTYINVMDQYHSAGAVWRGSSLDDFRALRRPTTSEEYRVAMKEVRAAGLGRVDRRAGRFVKDR